MALKDPYVQIPDPPAIPGLAFRCFRGERDYAGMAAIITAMSQSYGTERVATAEEVAHTYQHLYNCDPALDMIMAEVDGELVGYGRGMWIQQPGDGARVYTPIGFVHPDWRRRGLGGAILRFLERRLAEIAAGQPQDGPRYYQVFAEDQEMGTGALLENSGYKPVRYAFSMVRPDLDQIPEAPLPEGLEVRPVLPEHYRAIWDADVEAFRDHWGYVKPTEENYQAWLSDPTVFQPHLWKVAWDGHQVAGQVRSFINASENEYHQRKRGYTEFISVRRPWRRRGLARALIAQSLSALKEAGMSEAALGVDSENQSGALQLYESVGFKPVRRSTVYRKSLEAG